MNDSETIKKTLSFGKVDGYGNGRKSCEVTIDVELIDGELSICGNIWNARHTDALTCGQCYEDLLGLLPHNKKLQEVVTIWKRWHLNKLRPSCEHQRDLEWGEQASEPIYRWHIALDTDACDKQRRIKQSIAQQTNVSDEDAVILALPMTGVLYTLDETRPPTPEHYKVSALGCRPNPEHTTRGWINTSEHPAGILCKPCPVCGYQYGSEWKFEAVPDSVIEQIKAW